MVEKILSPPWESLTTGVCGPVLGPGWEGRGDGDVRVAAVIIVALLTPQDLVVGGAGA